MSAWSESDDVADGIDVDQHDGDEQYDADPIAAAVLRIGKWAAAHPECDTRGITVGEWIGIAGAALGLDGTEEPF